MSSFSSTLTYDSSYFKYHLKYDGKLIETIVTNQDASAKEWVNEILLVHANNPKVMVGLDVQWNLKHSVSPGTLHLCIDTKCLILQLWYMDEVKQSLKNILMNPKFTFIGVDEEIAKLVSHYAIDCAKSEDIRTATINKWPRRFQRHDFDHLAYHIAGLTIRKEDNKPLSSWGARVLDDNQVKYACIIAYASYKIGHKILVE